MVGGSCKVIGPLELWDCAYLSYSYHDANLGRCVRPMVGIRNSIHYFYLRSLYLFLTAFDVILLLVYF